MAHTKLIWAAVVAVFVVSLCELFHAGFACAILMNRLHDLTGIGPQAFARLQDSHQTAKFSYYGNFFVILLVAVLILWKQISTLAVLPLVIKNVKSKLCLVAILSYTFSCGLIVLLQVALWKFGPGDIALPSFGAAKILLLFWIRWYSPSSPNEDVMRLSEKLMPHATILGLKREEESLNNIKQFYTKCKDSNEKYQAIANIYGAITIGQGMIFCQTEKTASWLVNQLTKDGHDVAHLSGDLTADQRIAVLNRFSEAKERILITTNVMARGIDVEQVTLVVNYDLPVDSENYLHSIGRTGRFGKAGIAVNLVDSSKSMNVLRQIEGHFGKPIQKLNAEDVAELNPLET